MILKRTDSKMTRTCGSLAVIGTIFVLLLLFCTTESRFCGRPGYGCGQGTCDERTQTCNCTEGYYGFNCVIPEKYANCNDSCNGHGTCHSYDQCYCDLPYYGDKCQFKNETVLCNHDSIDIALDLAGPNDVYLLSNENCNFNKDRHMFLRDIYRYKQTFNRKGPGPCDGYKRQQIDEHRYMYIFDIAVREKKGFYSPLDYTTRLTCTYDFIETGTIQGTTEESKVFGIDIVDHHKSIITDGKVSTGHEFSLAFFPLKHAETKRIGVTDMTMIDSKTGRKMFKVINGMCVTYMGEDVLLHDPIIDQHQKENGDTVQATFVTFKKQNQQFSVKIVSSVKLCDGPCPVSKCPTSTVSKRVIGTILEIS